MSARRPVRERLGPREPYRSGQIWCRKYGPAGEADVAEKWMMAVDVDVDVDEGWMKG